MVGRIAKTVIILIISIFLGVGLTVTNAICTSNSENIKDQEWRKISDNYCRLSVSLFQSIKNIINNHS